jgi:hypothetical protein
MNTDLHTDSTGYMYILHPHEALISFRASAGHGEFRDLDDDQYNNTQREVPAKVTN